MLFESGKTRNTGPWAYCMNFSNIGYISPEIFRLKVQLYWQKSTWDSQPSETSALTLIQKGFVLIYTKFHFMQPVNKEKKIFQRGSCTVCCHVEGLSKIISFSEMNTISQLKETRQANNQTNFIKALRNKF